jgi:hypothetical protein
MFSSLPEVLTRRYFFDAKDGQLRHEPHAVVTVDPARGIFEGCLSRAGIFPYRHAGVRWSETTSGPGSAVAARRFVRTPQSPCGKASLR